MTRENTRDYSLNDMQIALEAIPIRESKEGADAARQVLLRIIDGEVAKLAEDLEVDVESAYELLEHSPAIRQDVVNRASELAKAFNFKPDPKCDANRRSWTGSPLKGGKPKSNKQLATPPQQ